MLDEYLISALCQIYSSQRDSAVKPAYSTCSLFDMLDKYLISALSQIYSLQRDSAVNSKPGGINATPFFSMVRNEREKQLVT